MIIVKFYNHIYYHLIIFVFYGIFSSGCSNGKINKPSYAHTHSPQRCIKKVTHTHPYKNANHKHKYSVNCRSIIQKFQTIDIRKLQIKLKQKGYYHGLVTGVLNQETIDSLTEYKKKKK